MGSWNGTKLGIKVIPEYTEEAEQFMKILGVDLGKQIIEEVGTLGKNLTPSIEGEVIDSFGDKAFGIMPILEEYFFSYQNHYFEYEDEYEDEYGDEEEIDDTGHSLDDLFRLINLIFPSTSVYLVHEDGDNTSDGYYRYEAIYDPVTEKKTIRNCFYCYGEEINCSIDDPKKEGTEIEVEKISGNAPQKEDIEMLIRKAEAENFNKLTERLRTCRG